MELAPSGKSSITLEELAKPYTKHLCEHLLYAPKQVTSGRSKFLQACKDFNAEMITYDELITITTKLGFQNVIDAFHNVNRAEIPIKFYEKNYNGSSKKIILTDAIFQLNELPTKENFANEVQSRWNLVETAWELGINRNLLSVNYDDTKKQLFVNDAFRRKDITSARGALNGYQKGKCFYCYDDIMVTDDTENSCDVDHFYPHTLQKYMPDINLDGIWNLVLTCQHCNRGKNGKFAQIPVIKYLERLYKRNEFLISSHHPLRETIIKQTGKTEPERKTFLNNIDRRAIHMLIHRWETQQIGEETF